MSRRSSWLLVALLAAACGGSQVPSEPSQGNGDAGAAADAGGVGAGGGSDAGGGSGVDAGSGGQSDAGTGGGGQTDAGTGTAPGDAGVSQDAGTAANECDGLVPPGRPPLTLDRGVGTHSSCMGAITNPSGTALG